MHISPNLFCPFYCPTICVTSLLKFCFRTVSDSSNSLFRSRCSLKLTLTWSTSFSNSLTEWTFYISSFFNTSLASSSFFFVSRSIFGILFTRYSVWSNLWRSSKFSWHEVSMSLVSCSSWWDTKVTLLTQTTWIPERIACSSSQALS